MEKSQREFIPGKHLEFIDNLEKNKTLYSIGFYVRNHLRMGGAYWAVTSLSLLKKSIQLEQQNELVRWIQLCQNIDGGFGGNEGHDSHLTSTLYALLVLYQLGAMEQVDLGKVAQYVDSLFVKDTGAFMGDIYGETDTRFIYSGLFIYVLLDIDLPPKSLEFLRRCINEDGGFGGQPEVESHSAYVFCGISAVALLGKLEQLPLKKIKSFLATRQTKFGGFNGRPEKLPDVCYSWWVLSSLHTVNSALISKSKFHSAFMRDHHNNPNVSISPKVSSLN